ncbi:alpha/beta fold hydrolase [bacterium]|nr:alpha/beta fold hydrolase [bacterium]
MLSNSFTPTPANVSKHSANANSFLKGEKDITLICIHGFTGSSSDFSIVASYLSDEFKINCLSLGLPGHTGKISDLKNIHYQDWLHYIEDNIQSYINKGHAIHIMGLSMGASLSMIIANKLHNKIKSITLFSPALWTLNRMNDFILHCLTKLPRCLIPNINIKKNKKQDEVLLFDAYPLHSLTEYKKVTLLAEKALATLNCPSLLVYSEDDDVISPQSSQFIYKHSKNPHKKIIRLKHAGHIIPKIQDQEQQLLLKELKEFYMNFF